MLDPLAFAAEQAWHKGIVVVVAVGNEGLDARSTTRPTDPYVIAVGSDNANGTADTADDAVSSFSNNGNGTRNPDVVAPGDRVVSLRSTGSYLDTTSRRRASGRGCSAVAAPRRPLPSSRVPRRCSSRSVRSSRRTRSRRC